jgi:hypothetical protein
MGKHANTKIGFTPDKYIIIVMELTTKALKHLELDRISLTHRYLSKCWQHGEITRQTIEKWMDQFQQADNNGWIAERLLAVLDVWSSNRMIRALRISDKSLAGLSCVCVNSERLGGSSSAIANAIRKQLDSSAVFKLDLEGLKSALESRLHGRLLYVEDCLLSGNEMVRVLSGLLGIPDRYGAPKSTALTNAAFLKDVEIRLRFGVICNGGLAYLRSFLKEQGLENTSVDYYDNEMIESHTLPGIESINNGTLYDDEGCVTDPESKLVRVAFRDLEIWGSPELRAKGRAICQEIGKQLYEQYLARRGKVWTKRRVEEAGLGVCGLALALAFSHSVPKASLPIFWMRGKISYNRRIIDWEPLFPNAV